MKKIPLTQGQFALVDDVDYKMLCRFKWYAVLNRGKFYAARHLNNRLYFMHRHILDVKPGDIRTSDHIDGNGLNNSRLNLRLATQKENTRNRPGKRDFSSRYKGVSIFQTKHWPPLGILKWRSVIGCEGKNYSLGIFDSEEDAAKAYDQAAKKYFGDFAWLNFPKNGRKSCF